MSNLGEITPCWTLIIHRRSKHPPQRLWRAITDVTDLCKWMKVPKARIDLRVGGEYWVDFGEGGPPEGLPGVIVRLEPQKTLAYVWGYSVIEWRIEPDGDGSKYSFADHGNETRDGSPIAAGWHGWIDALSEHLGDDVNPTPDASYERYEREYRAKLDALLAS